MAPRPSVSCQPPYHRWSAPIGCLLRHCWCTDNTEQRCLLEDPLRLGAPYQALVIHTPSTGQCLRSTMQRQQVIDIRACHFTTLQINWSCHLPWELVDLACRHASGRRFTRSYYRLGWIACWSFTGSPASPSCPSASWSSLGRLGTRMPSAPSSGTAWLISWGSSWLLQARPSVTSRSGSSAPLPDQYTLVGLSNWPSSRGCSRHHKMWRFSAPPWCRTTSCTIRLGMCSRDSWDSDSSSRREDWGILHLQS